MERDPLIIGWKEYVEFVDWRIRHVRAKIDTGARTSAIGVVSYEIIEDPVRGMVAVLWLALNRRHPDRVRKIVTPVLRMIVVSNSSGMREKRPLVETTLRIGPVEKVVQFTVTNRSAMRFGMILGRKALHGDFVVDVSKKYLLKKLRRP